MSQTSSRTSEELAVDYPCVGIAYPLAVAAYDVARQRLDAMDSRLQSLISMGTGASTALIVLLANRGLRLGSVLFILAMLAFAAAVGTGVYARLAGPLRVIGISVIFAKYLGVTTWEFQNQIILNAGEDQRANKDVIDRKNLLASISMLAFAAELTLLAVWAMTGHL